MQPIPVPPIADPNAKPQRHFEGAEVREFRPRFWVYFLSNWMGGLAFGAFLLWLLHLLTPGERTLPSVERIAAVLAFSVVLMLLMTAYIWRFMPIKVGRWGLRAATCWTMPQEVAWSRMSSAHYLWFVYPYAIISCVGQPKLWVWFALETPREFAASVSAFTAPDHPLHAFLARRGLVDSIEPTD